MSAIDRIKEMLEDKSLNLKDFTDLTGVNYRTLQNYLSGDRKVSSEFLSVASEHMNISASWLLTGKGPMYLPDENKRVHISDATSPDFVSVPRYDVAASAGHGTAPAHEEGTGHYAFNRKWIERRGLNVDNLAVISVKGDSMEPELHDQDLIVLDHSQTKPNDGDIFVVRYSDDLFVKRVQHLPQQKIQLRSTNTHYSPIEINITTNPDFTFIGKVVASMHEW